MDASLGSHDGGNDRVSRERGTRYAYRVHSPILLLVSSSLPLTTRVHDPLRFFLLFLLFQTAWIIVISAG